MRAPIRTLLALVVVVAAVSGGVGARATTDAGHRSTKGATACRFPFSATDATGTRVTVKSEPRRIVTLAPSAAQTMWEIGGKDKVVGVSQYAAYLEGAESRTNVSASDDGWVDVETVISLRPDLVLAPDVISNATVAKLREAGLTVYKFESAETIDDIERQTIKTGRLTGECAGARETVAWMERKLRTVRDAVEGTDRPTVLYVFFGYTAGKGTFVHSAITIAGGRNVAAMANVTGFAQLSPEVVAKYDPHWIVLNDGATRIPETEVYNDTYAVRHDQIVVVEEEHISQPAPRIVLAIVKLAKAFHPRAYERAASTAGTPASPTEPATATPTQTPAGTTTGVPGFGVGVAVVSLATLALSARGKR